MMGSVDFGQQNGSCRLCYLSGGGGGGVAWLLGLSSDYILTTSDQASHSFPSSCQFLPPIPAPCI